MKRILNLRMREVETPGLPVMDLEARMAVDGECLGGTHRNRRRILESAPVPRRMDDRAETEVTWGRHRHMNQESVPAVTWQRHVRTAASISGRLPECVSEQGLWEVSL